VYIMGNLLSQNTTKQSGGASGYMGLFYASGPAGGSREISHATLRGINNAPMFNPLSATATIPTLPSTGIIPNGAYLASMPMTGGAVAATQQKPVKVQAKAKAKPIHRNCKCKSCTC
jgi:hypothetical protein